MTPDQVSAVRARVEQDIRKALTMPEGPFSKSGDSIGVFTLNEVISKAMPIVDAALRAARSAEPDSVPPADLCQCRGESASQREEHGPRWNRDVCAKCGRRFFTDLLAAPTVAQAQASEAGE